MTRRDQIEEAATQHRDKGGGPSDICHNCQVFNWAAFVTGAEWADQKPNTKDGCVECHSTILADTENWPNPLCYECFTKHFHDIKHGCEGVNAKIPDLLNEIIKLNKLLAQAEEMAKFYAKECKLGCTPEEAYCEVKIPAFDFLTALNKARK